MSSTNKTANYELSQFIGSDKPAWLADYDSDMSKIDTQMKANADGINTVDGKADTNAANIGNLANLNTTAKTDLVSATNEVYNTASTANGTAQSAAGAATSAKTEADALTAYLSITNTAKISPSIVGGTTGNINDLYYALNAAGTLGKVYGRYRFTTNTSGTVTITLPITGLNPSASFVISGACYYNTINAGQYGIINARDITVNTNNTITITFTGLSVGDSVTIWLPPCLYFFTDFGDVINPDA